MQHEANQNCVFNIFSFISKSFQDATPASFQKSKCCLNSYSGLRQGFIETFLRIISHFTNQVVGRNAPSHSSIGQPFKPSITFLGFEIVSLPSHFRKNAIDHNLLASWINLGKAIAIPTSRNTRLTQTTACVFILYFCFLL